MCGRPRKAFTLIELLIVVAIIAILAAIAVPNFLEAQTRSKVSRAKADIRSLATALESYATDANNKYPFDITLTNGFTPGAGYFWYMCNWVTTPIAYITSNKLIDPFRDKTAGALPTAYWRYRYVNLGFAEFNNSRSLLPGGPAQYQAYLEGRNNYGMWRLTSSGPDNSAGPWPGPGAASDPNAILFPAAVMLYDPTNGTRSRGDVVRSQKTPDGVYVPRNDYP